MEGREGRRPTSLRSRLGHRNPDGPALPADLLVAPATIPCLAAPLLKKLHRDGAPAVAALPSPARRAATTGTQGPQAGPQRGGPAGAGAVVVDALGVEALGQLVGALLDHGVELGVGGVGKGDVEDLARARGDGGEEAVEEDGMEDPCVCFFFVIQLLFSPQPPRQLVHIGLGKCRAVSRCAVACIL